MRPLVALAALLLSACPDDGGPMAQNPTKLWLALDGSERAVKLSVQEPTPY
jgi:hypothetical protein